MVELYLIVPGSVPAQGGAQEVGNKAWNLMRMIQFGLPIPPAFVLPTAWCQRTQPADQGALRRTLAEVSPDSSRDRPCIRCGPPRSTLARLGSLRSCCIHAGNDGNRVKCRPERRDG